MTHPDDDTLAAIALGDPAPSGAAEHAHSCPECSQALASLRDTLTTLHAPVPELVAPPAVGVGRGGGRARPRAGDHHCRTGIRGNAAGDDAGAARPQPRRMPATSSAGGVPRAPAGVASRWRGSRVLPRPAWSSGVVGTRLVDDEPGTSIVPGGTVTTVASASLDTLDTQQVMGTADVVRHDGRLDLTVSTTAPMDADGGYLEVWLINKDLKRMVSVGVLDPATSDQSFVIPQDLLDQGYVIVDISREGYDEAPQHSGDSLVRGTLAT